jgi:hypothetical protein
MADGYRDSSGHYLPHNMSVSEAVDRGVADKYFISNNYHGNDSSAIGSLTQTNPYEYGHHDTHASEHTKTGNNPDFVSADKWAANK